MALKKLYTSYKFLVTAALILAVMIVAITVLTRPASFAESGYPIIQETQEQSFKRCYYILNHNERYRCFGELFSSYSECTDLYNKLNESYKIQPHFCDSVFAIKLNDYTKCDNTKDYSIGICVGEYASFKDDVSICNNAFDNADKNDKQFHDKISCLQTFAFNAENYEVCDMIEHEGRAGMCAVLIAVAKRDKEKCLELKESTKEFCLKSFRQ